MKTEASAFYKEVEGLAEEAIVLLEKYLKGPAGADFLPVFNAIRIPGAALLDGTKLIPDVRRHVGLRFEQELLKAALYSSEFNTLTTVSSSGDQNTKIKSALDLIRIHAGRVKSELEATERGLKQTGAVAMAKSGVFVAEGRIETLRQLREPSLDPVRLIRLLEEINVCYENDCFMAVAMLIRAVTDHVPSVFGVTGFAQVLSNVPGTSRSFRESMTHLDKSLRKIADAHLHVPMRVRETVPMRQQVVGYQGDVDILLAEVIRVLS